MTVRIDPKSLLVGAALAGLLVLVVGDAKGQTNPQVGRFRLACTNTRAYLVDNVTGQAWESGTPGFSAPKRPAKAPAMPAQASAFVGRWVSVDPDHDSLAVTLDADYRCVATGEGEAHNGRWRAEGERIFITIDDETVTGQVGADGRLVLWEEGDEADRIPFARVE